MKNMCPSWPLTTCDMHMRICVSLISCALNTPTNTTPHRAPRLALLCRMCIFRDSRRRSDPPIRTAAAKSVASGSGSWAGTHERGLPLPSARLGRRPNSTGSSSYSNSYLDPAPFSSSSSSSLSYARTGTNLTTVSPNANVAANGKGRRGVGVSLGGGGAGGSAREGAMAGQPQGVFLG